MLVLLLVVYLLAGWPVALACGGAFLGVLVVTGLEVEPFDRATWASAAREVVRPTRLKVFWTAVAVSWTVYVLVTSP